MPTPEYYERKRKYIQRYNKSHYRSMSICFRADDPDEMELYTFLQSRYSTVQYIKDLARAAMEREKAKENEGD